jgi:hypothetical protein
MVLLDWQYFGTISFVQSFLNEKEVSFDNTASFSKMSFKNRTIISTAQGPLTLTIPITGGRSQKLPIQDISIAYDSPWHKQHFKAIKSSYQRAPFFEYYENSLQTLYQNPSEKLVDFLLDCHLWLKNQMKGEWVVHNESTHDLELGFTKKMDPWLPNNYNKQPNPIFYKQVFEPQIEFIPNVSILDMLFCCGGKTAGQTILNNY